MVQIPNPGLGSSRRSNSAMSGSKHENDLQQGNAPPHDPSVSSVSVDIDKLSLLVMSSNKDSTPTPRVSLQRTLSRKQPIRGEVAVGDATPPAAKIPSLVGAMGSSPVTVNVEADDRFPLLPPVLTHTANGGGGVRSRRASKRRRSPCNDPRAVLLFFMILSSVGSLLILFLTFYGGKINGGDGQ